MPFPPKDRVSIHWQITARVARENEIEVSAVCKRKAAVPPTPSSVITLFNLHFILKHMYRNKQIINSSLSSILCLACNPSRGSLFPWRTAEGLAIGWGGQIHYSLWAASNLIFHMRVCQRGGERERARPDLGSAYWGEGTPHLGCAHMFHGWRVGLWPGVCVSVTCTLCLCVAEPFWSEAICSASWGPCGLQHGEKWALELQWAEHQLSCTWWRWGRHLTEGSWDSGSLGRWGT